MEPELSSRLQNITNLPTPPAVAAQVINLAQQPDIRLGEVAEAITCDPSLTAKILRVANSPIYAQRRQSMNLQQALVVLGINTTVTLALGFSLLPMLRRSPADNQHLAHAWRRSVLAAVAARVLADKVPDVNSEEAFLAALLQDIGVMAIDRIEPDFYSACHDFQHDHLKLSAYEIDKLGDDHATVGAWLLTQWNMPEYLQDAVAHSHTLDSESPDNSRHCLRRCVALSGLVADLWLGDTDDEAGFSTVADTVERATGMDRETFAMVMAEIGNSIPDMADMFQTRLVGEVEAQLIVERAQEALTARCLKSIHEVAELGKKTRELSSLALELRSETQRDALTRVASRSHLNDLLERSFTNAKRFGWTLSIAFVDLDLFKTVNDTYGHQVGDLVLKEIAALLVCELRSSDTVGRYGGEEFMLILPGANQADVQVACNRILSRLRDTHHDIGDGRLITVTASIGCATMSKSDRFETIEDMVRASDTALYAAKDKGRDCLIRYGSDIEPGQARFA